MKEKFTLTGALQEVPRIVLKVKDNQVIVDMPFVNQLIWLVVTPDLQELWCYMESTDGCLGVIKDLSGESKDGKTYVLDLDNLLKFVVPGSLFYVGRSLLVTNLYKQGGMNGYIADVMKHYGIKDYVLPEVMDPRW